MALDVKSRLPDNPIRHLQCTAEDAAKIVPKLVDQCRSFYYEPGPDDTGCISVDPEHADYVLKQIRNTY